MEPTFSPWGEVDECIELLKGVYMVSTPSHGGILVAPESHFYFSAAARKCAFRDGGYLCFEEDCAEPVALRDLLDSGLWKVPADRIKDPAAFEASLEKNIREYNPSFWAAHEKRVQKQTGQKPKQAHAPVR